jgi:hypothetical protein
VPQDAPPPGRKERRRLKRFVKRVPVRFEAAGLRAQGDIGNLHQEGLFIRSHVLPDPGAEVVVSFTAPAGEPVEVAGTVRWTTKESPAREPRSGFGVQLHRVSEEYLSFFRSLLLAGPIPSD